MPQRFKRAVVVLHIASVGPLPICQPFGKPGGLRFTGTRIETRDDSTWVPVDRRGRLIINWPMTGRRGWADSIPQVSLADIAKLDDYEFDVRLARHQLRQCIAGLDQYGDGKLGWAANFDLIVAAYAEARLADAAELERGFEPARAQAVYSRSRSGNCCSSRRNARAN